MRIVVVIALLLAGCGDNITPSTHDAGMDGLDLECGNGVVDDGEQCDDGDANGGPTARCTTMCRWVCSDDSACNDHEPCNGVETCVDHACVAGTEQVDGTSCGDNKVCRNAACTDGVCGDQFVTGTEECDDANTVDGDGCDNCRFSCVSSDSARNCIPTDACAGQGTCNDSTHTCTPGTPLADNVACGSGGYCKNGTCTQPSCGNGIEEPGEACDLGTSNGTTGSGCKSDCTFECVNAATDCPTAPACQKQTCSTSHTCHAVADTTQNAATCGTDLVCNNGACVSPTAVCGNGIIETGEQCDFGSSSAAGSGCETNCQFSCTMTPTDSCGDGNPCNGTETCTTVTVGDQTGQKCTTTAPLSNGAVCGTGQICLSQTCVNSSCGDGFVDTNAGEQCEPPNTATCSASCKHVVCGDGVRAGAEQCDDGNTTNLDGCDSACKFEQCHRVNALTLDFATSTYCTANALGGAVVGSFARTEISSALTSGVKDGSITIELKAFGLDDLTGTADPSLQLGALTGTPVAGTGYDGTNDLDWWYTTAASVIDAMRNPTTMMAATIAAKVLNAGPTDISLSVNLGGNPATLSMLRAKLRGNVGTTSSPLVSTGSTPGHLPSEDLDPSLVSFDSVTNGQLCGDIVAQSLASVPIPDALVGCTFLTCSQCYTASNTLLDVIVGGCGTLLGTQIKATQPDTARTIGDAYTFTRNNTTKAVTGCTKNGQPGTLSECLMNAAYTSLWRFTSGRVIAK
jgi:cysteine-rich repeat protein